MPTFGRPLQSLFAIICAVLIVVAQHEMGRTAVPGKVTVEVVDIDGTIDAGMAHRVEQAISDARTQGAHAIMLRIATNGGSVDDANRIKAALEGAGLQTIAFVTDRAWSAGALISLACDKIVMAPGSSMGATLPIEIGPGGETPVDAKIISAIRTEMESLAEQHQRDPQLAAGMVDPNVVIPGLKKKGEILSLTPNVALQHHFIDGIESTDVAALARFGVHDAALVLYAPTLGEQIAQFVSDPVVSGLLLSIGFLGLLIELQTRYFVAGIVAILALGLFFGAHIIAGASTWVIVTLFGLGILGLLFEMHILPGHGISGLIGALLIMSSIVLAFGAGAVLLGIETMAISLIVSILAFILLLRWLPESAMLKRLAFAGAQSTSEGYVAAPTLSHLLGKEGVAESTLRPAGWATIDGARYEVQSGGDFIPAQTRIRVETVMGSKIFVRRA